MSRLNKILAGFQKTVNQLDQLVADNDRDIDFHASQIKALDDKREALVSENIQAGQVAGKIRALIAA